MFKQLMSKLEIWWVAVTYAEAGEPETALAILQNANFQTTESGGSEVPSLRLQSATV